MPEMLCPGIARRDRLASDAVSKDPLHRAVVVCTSLDEVAHLDKSSTQAPEMEVYSGRSA